MDTTKNQVMQAMKNVGEKPGDIIVCYYQNHEGEFRLWESDEEGNPLVFPLIPCVFDTLPEREFDAGYGGTNGEPVICFSEKYVYIKRHYDGNESVQAVPRHPESVREIPWVGG